MGSTTTHGLPYPVGTDRVMDGDNAMQALAEAVDAQLYAGTGAPGAPGMWANATGVVVCTNSSLTAAPGTAINFARYMKLGRTVFFQGEATITTAVVQGAIALPNSVAGVPLNRQYACGTFQVAGASAPTTQTGVGFMNSAKDRLLVTTLAAALLDMPASTQVRWSVLYETTT